MDFKNDPRFKGITPFNIKVWLSSPTMHGDEQRWVDEAIQTNWVSTVGANINEVEKQIAATVVWYGCSSSGYKNLWGKAIWSACSRSRFVGRKASILL